MRGEESEIVGSEIDVEPDGCGKAAVDRQHRAFQNVFEADARASAVEHEDAFRKPAAVTDYERQITAAFADKAESQRDDHRLFGRLPRRRWDGLRELYGIGLGGSVVAAGHSDMRRAGFAVPAHELRNVASAQVGKALDELFDRCRLAVVTREVQ